ncbi:TAXI family TRAP transporter solute-binding subunit [Microbulbifer sp. S227A]|uniref:TAXI family TRAP transporter solute-binding subunit n=1 Tax=Microbulbifer sp. S227A TaxID=3415131 RepID=UPI003C7B141F
MKTRKKSILARCVALAVLLTGLSLPVQAQQFEKNILTGGPSGTYIQFGRNVSDIAAKCGVNLQVQESAGSLENFLGVRKRRFTQFGIVQSDVLEYLKTFAADDPGVARAILGVRIAFPLYNEEVHVLGTKDINSLADLNGKRIAVGVEDSGTFLTASLVLDLAQVNPAERLTINAEESLAALLNGQIDAFFYVAGAPTRIFQSPQIDGDRFHLVPINDPTLQAVYVPATIPAGAYAFQADPVDVVAVKAVLMTYEYDPNRNAYHRESCKAVSDISHLISSRFSELQETGHPKWKQVDPTALPPGWNIGSCVNVGLDPNYPLTCEGDLPTVGAGQGGSESEANSAYRRQICATIGC